MNYQKAIFFLCFTLLGAGVVISDKSGPTGDYSGAPMANGSQGRTCATLTGCHNNNADLNAAISIGFALKGDTQQTTSFADGKTYTVTVKVSGSSVARGFQTTILSASHSATGTISNISSGAKKIALSQREFVEHSSPSSVGTWTFDWTATAGSPDTVVIYGAGNAANNNSAATGDDIATTSLTLIRDAAASAGSTAALPAIQVFPNPVKDKVRFSEIMDEVRVYDLQGAVQMTAVGCDHLDLSGLSAGHYLLWASHSRQIIRMSLCKQQ